MGRSHAQRIRLRRSGARVRYTTTAAAISGSATSAYIALARYSAHDPACIARRLDDGASKARSASSNPRKNKISAICPPDGVNQKRAVSTLGEISVKVMIVSDA